MASQAIVSTHAPSTPIVRPFSSTAALWIHNHPKSAFLVFCVLAAGYGIALGLGNLTSDTFISVAAVGGVVLLVSAYALKRLIFMPPLVHAKHLLGLKALTGYEQVYFVGDDQRVHVLKFDTKIDLNKVIVKVDEEGKKRFGQNIKYVNTMPGNNECMHYLSSMSPEALARLSETMKTNAGRKPDQMIEFALGMARPQSGQFKIQTQHEYFTANVIPIELEGRSSWSIQLPRNLINQIPDLVVTYSLKDVQELYLIEATNINLALVNYLRAAKKEPA